MAISHVLLQLLTALLLTLGHCGAALDRSDCDEKSQRQSTLKFIKEMPFSGLFRDLRNNTKFEASGIAKVRGEFWVVFDSSESLGLLDDRFQFRAPENALVGEKGEVDSQYEGIAYVPESDTFLLLHEALPGDGKEESYKPSIRSVKVDKEGKSYDTLAVCDVDFELTSANKGFESIQYLTTQAGGGVLLGLCEGNYCEGGRWGRDPGNGRVVVSALQSTADGGCLWVPQKTLEIPPSAAFRDYSALALNYATSKVAILSQEDAAVWIGDFDVDKLEFASEGGVVYHLPRDNHCEVQYCNAEGLQWVDDWRVVVVSDKAKGSQPYACDARDQSVHIFSLPPTWDPYAPAPEPARGGEGGTSGGARAEA